MSDAGVGPEQNLSYGQRFMSNLFSGVSLKLTGLDEARAQLEGLTSAVKELKDALQGISQNQHQLTSGITSVMKTVQTQAQQTATAVNAVTGQGGTPGSGGTGSPQAAIAAAQGQQGGRQPGMSIGGRLIGAMQSNLARDIALFPLRFTQDVFKNNRDLALGASNILGAQSWISAQGGTGQQQFFRALQGLPGSVMGSPEELLSLYGVAPQAGAMLGFGQLGSGRQMNAPRAAGFFQGIRQMQMMSPGTPVTSLAQTLGSYGTNTQAQQQSAYLTGGAFSLVGSGGRQRSLQEWAESILRWLEGLRMTGKRGQGFTYEELISQRFPGSNIDAWFATNGVPVEMREFWWTYALGKANKVTSTATRDFSIRGEEQNLAFQRLKSTTPLTQTGFGLASQLVGTYSNKEQANRWFNELMGQVIQSVVPSVISRGPMSFMQFLPDTIQDMLMSLIESGGGLGTVIGGLVGWGPSIFSQGGLLESASNLAQGLGGAGDVGDVGDYGPMGGTSTAGLHPDMRRKVGAMMHANPRLRMTSGLRDRSTQMRLRGKGYSRVSGGPSAHTRGLAADLGPPSEYGWLMSNAGKYGLKSGVSHGEPWHVGIGDDGPSPSLWSLFKAGGMDQGEQIALIGGLIPGLLNMMLGAFGKFAEQGADPSRLAFRGTTYRDLSQAQSTYTIGGKFDLMKYLGLPQATKLLGGALPSFMFPNLELPGGGGGRVPRGPWPQAGSDEAGIRVAKLAAATGWAGQDIWKAVAISGRESSWNPMAHRTSTGRTEDWTTGDRGLFQINASHDFNWPSIYTNANDLKDPVTNAKAAYQLWSGTHSWTGGWGVNPDTGKWDGKSDPLTNTDIETAKRLTAAAGFPVGDVDFYSGGSTKVIRSGGTMIFNNSFQLGAGGSVTGIDAKRTASMIAEHLEEEMKRRSARMN